MHHSAQEDREPMQLETWVHLWKLRPCLIQRSMSHFVGHESSQGEESIFGHDLQFVYCSLWKHALQCFSNLPYHISLNPLRTTCL